MCRYPNCLCNTASTYRRSYVCYMSSKCTTVPARQGSACPHYFFGLLNGTQLCLRHATKLSSPFFPCLSASVFSLSLFSSSPHKIFGMVAFNDTKGFPRIESRTRPRTSTTKRKRRSTGTGLSGPSSPPLRPKPSLSRPPTCPGGSSGRWQMMPISRTGSWPTPCRNC